MRILLSRARIGKAQPSYAYRVFVPFTEISLERQRLISMHSDYGQGAGLLARLSDVIASMVHLEASPGLEKFRGGLALEAIASRLGALLLHAGYPEMLERSVPFRLLVPIAPPPAIRCASVINLAGRYDWVANQIASLDAQRLGFRLEGER